MMEEDYAENEKEKDFDFRKPVSILAVIIVLIIIAVLLMSLFSQQSNLLFGPKGEKISGSVKIFRNNELISSTESQSDALKLNGNPKEELTGRISIPSLSSGKKSGKITIKNPNGKIVVLDSLNDFYFDENGQIVFNITPFEDFELDQYYNEETGEYDFPDGFEYTAEIEIIIEYEETGETAVIIVPIVVTFNEFAQKGCIALNRSSVRETTHFGSLAVDAKIRVLCDTQESLMSGIEWTGEKTGNVELILGNYDASAVMMSYPKKFIPVPLQGEYSFKIIFTPFYGAEGKKASFKLHLVLGQDDSVIDFDVPIENLEQCISISQNDLVIKKSEDYAEFDISVSQCSSELIEISLCDNDAYCSGGTEGGIDLSKRMVSLSPKGNSTTKIRIMKQEVPGIYGIPIYARIPGSDKTFIDEKIVNIEPFNGELVVPEKFEISLMAGAKDSVKVHNYELAEDVEIDATICALYESSMGLSEGAVVGGVYSSLGGNSWWYDLAVNSDKYAGRGKYQAAVVNTLAEMDYMRAATQQTARQKNYFIKTAYLNSTGLVSSSELALEKVTLAQAVAQDLQDKISEQNQYAETDLASQIAGMVSTITSLYTSWGITDAEVTAAQSAVALVRPCKAISAQITTANNSMAAAKEASVSGWAQAAGVLYAINALYSLYSSIESLASDAEEIDAESALSNINQALEKMNTIYGKAQNATELIYMALVSASIEGFTTANQEHAEAKEYLEEAQIELEATVDLIDEAKTKLITAADDITVAIQSEDEQRRELIIQAISLLVSIIEMSTVWQSDMAIIKSSLISANGELTTAIGIAAEQCSTTEILGGDSTCCPVATTGPAAITEINVAMSSTAMISTQIAGLLGQVNTVYQAFRMYQQIVNDYSSDYAQTQTALMTAIEETNNLQLAVNLSYNSLEPAIDAAEWLSVQETESARGSGYEDILGLSGEYNKERLTGLVSSAIMNGFVNGAYEGGVYTTQNTFSNIVMSPKKSTDKNMLFFSTLENECENKVKLKLPDYVINLWKDAKAIEISNPYVVAQWDFSDLQTFDVFEEQEAGITFSNNGLKKNSYGLVNIVVDKHKHAQPTSVDSMFGPFDIPDIEKKQVTYTYHFRFNAEPKKSKRFEPFSNNICVDGLLRGETGENAVPRTITSWEWDSVVTEGIAGRRTTKSAVVGKNNSNEPFLDATQLTIFLSKKIGSLASFLERVSPACPENPGEEVLQAVQPLIINSETGEVIDVSALEDPNGNFCYLPLTTRTYDGKPALYYYIENQTVPGYDDDFEDTQQISTANELIELVDFNAYLMRDGYGVDFQADFVGAYSSKILLAGPSFLDPVKGTKKYFQSQDNFYYTSVANALQQKMEWFLPDAGKYRIRMFIDFKDVALLYTGSTPSAKIITTLDLIEPVGKDYSPFYYTPFDGFTGLNAKDNRKSYGSSLLSAPEQFAVSKDQGAYLSLEQKDSLVKMSMKKISSFALLNALPSLRGKIIELSYAYNPATRKDDNSYLIYSPTVATPLILELNAKEGQSSSLNYGVIRNRQDLSSNLNNMFLLSAVGDCSNLSGEKLSNYFNYTPDFGYDKDYGVVFGVPTQTGLTYLKTTAYSPIAHSYALRLGQNTKAYASDDQLGINNPQTLSGIIGMPLNDQGNNSIPESLDKILQGVSDGYICVSSLGSKEIFWRPNAVLEEWENSDGKNMNDVQVQSMQKCAKAQN